MELYTSEVHLKRVLGGSSTPAFTPLSGDAAAFIDPAFVPGEGAFNEDANGLLQCPVRGCGKFFPTLANHINQVHAGVGGVAAVKAALSVPKHVSLISARVKHARSTRIARQGNPGALLANAWRGGGKAGRSTSTTARNNSDTCTAQLRTKITAMLRDMGRSPSAAEFSARYGAGALGALLKVYGTWNNAKAACGLSTQPGVWTRADVLHALRAWYDAHGDLPTSEDVQNHADAPYLPAYVTIRRALGADNWHAAMRSAVDHLSVASERYGTSAQRTA